MIAVGWWIVFGGGLIVLAGIGTSVSTKAFTGIGGPPTAATTTTASTTGAVTHDVNLALRRLNEADPEVYAKLANPTRPRLSTTNGLPTYTWEYVTKQSPSSASVRRISVTLNSSGQIVGVTSGP